MKSLLILTLFSVTAIAETDPRPKLLNLYYNGTQPTLGQMKSIRIGRCYNVDAKELKTLGGLFVGKAIDGQNGPLFEESDLVKFWAFSDESPREFDNFPAQDFLNGNSDFNRSYEFRSLENSAFRSDNGWTQVKDAYSSESRATGPTFRKHKRTVMRARMNEKYLITAYGAEYEEFSAKEKCYGIFDRSCYWVSTDKKLRDGFNITEICYFYKRID